MASTLVTLFIMALMIVNVESWWKPSTCIKPRCIQNCSSTSCNYACSASVVDCLQSASGTTATLTCDARNCNQKCLGVTSCDPTCSRTTTAKCVQNFRGTGSTMQCNARSCQQTCHRGTSANINCGSNAGTCTQNAKGTSMTLKCDARVCNQVCEATSCTMICTSKVKVCKQTCTRGWGCKFDCKATSSCTRCSKGKCVKKAVKTCA